MDLMENRKKKAFSCWVATESLGGFIKGFSSNVELKMISLCRLVTTKKKKEETMRKWMGKVKSLQNDHILTWCHVKFMDYCICGG